MIKILKTTPQDHDTILKIELAAFDQDPEIKTLITDLLNDPTAKPIVSLLAYDGDKAVGHILFTKAKIKPGLGICSLKPGGHILAPMAVIPEYQKQGIGGKLIKEGLRILKDMGVERCFVLGHPAYYPHYGFIPDAGKFGLPAPYPIPEKDKDAWMVQDLAENSSKLKGQIICANAMMKPEYWRE
ncbi:MAG: N-acetyltransferase [Candidatus Marinimicrobia bacterium]|nr:N-acetyltransferase [Candidatus Neomarinimicrobiota bacterium]